MRINSITLENFRIFKETTEINLKPVTAIVGPNNSGKSSIIKAILFLQSNLKSFPFLQKIEFEDIKNHRLDGLTSINSGADFKISVNSCEEKSGVYEEREFLQIDFCFSGFNHNNTVELFCISLWYNGIEVLQIYPNSDDLNLVKVWFPLSKLKNYLNEIDYKLDLDLDKDAKRQIRKDLGSLVEEHFRHNIEKYEYQISVEDIINDVGLAGIKEIYVNFLNEFKNEFIQILKTKKMDSLVHFHGFTNLKNIEQLVEPSVEHYLHTVDAIKNISHLPSVRGLTKLIFGGNNDSNTKLDEILPMIFKNIPLDISEKEFSKLANKKREIIDFINYWINKMDIGQRIIIEKLRGNSYSISILRNNEKIELANLGFGYTQFLPILLQTALFAIGDENKNKIMMIEEPEANLHPAFHSLLAELFVNFSKKYKIQFLIETHSEYLIRKFQYLVAKKHVSPDYKKAYESYFNNRSKLVLDSKTLKFMDTYFLSIPFSHQDIIIHYLNIREGLISINIREDGSLTDRFGSGFFDEADMLAIDLYNLSNNQSN
jgi:AAA15 family ATPase/GTPase